MNDGQKTPRGHPNLNSYINIYVFWYTGWTDGRTDRWTEKSIRCGLGNLLVPPGKGKSVNLSAVDLSILLDFQAPELTDWQINRFALFVSPQELLICQSLDLISTISEKNSSISMFCFRTIFWERDGRDKVSIIFDFWEQ
jgi:hypothetical protein